MTILQNSDLNDDQKKLLFVSGLVLALASDMAEQGDAQARYVGFTTIEIVQEVLADVSKINVDPEQALTGDEMDDQFHAELHARIRRLAFGK